MQLAGPYSSAFLNMQLAGKAMLCRDPAYPCDADSAIVVHPKHFRNIHMAPTNFKLVSMWSESDQIETELEIRRGPITQPNAPYLAASCSRCMQQGPKIGTTCTPTCSGTTELVYGRAAWTPSASWMSALALTLARCLAPRRISVPQGKLPCTAPGM